MQKEHGKRESGEHRKSGMGGFFNALVNREESSAGDKFKLTKESHKMKDIIVSALNAHESLTQKCVVFQVYINRIFNIDDVAQELNVDMYLKLNWRSNIWVGKTDEEFQEDEQKTSWWSPGVEVSNAIELEEQTEQEEAFWLEIPEEGILAYTQRYIGTVATNMDLHQFPFDKQRITINFESFHWKEADMKMVVPHNFQVQLPPAPGNSWPSMNSEVVLHNWSIDEISVKERPKYYEFEDRTYSQVQVSLKVQREVRYYFYKVLVVLWLIVGMSWAVFFCDADDISTRLSLLVTLFLAAVAFNFAIGGSLPKVPYNTMLDQNLLVGYSYIAVLVVECLIVFHLVDSGAVDPDVMFTAECWLALAFAMTYIIYNAVWLIVSEIKRRRNKSYRDPDAVRIIGEEDDAEIEVSVSAEIPLATVSVQ